MMLSPELNIPDYSIELSLGGRVAGVDEVGRGALAGPVVAAAIIIDERAFDIGIKDSKKLSAKQREIIYEFLTNNYEYKVAFVDNETVDKINILRATMMAMNNSIKAINRYDYIIIDGRDKPFDAENLLTFVKGDNKSLSIAAASIVAKVERDRYMKKLSEEFPNYKWETNMGYGSKQHIKALKDFGFTKYHRKSFMNKILTRT